MQCQTIDHELLSSTADLLHVPDATNATQATAATAATDPADPADPTNRTEATIPSGIVSDGPAVVAKTAKKEKGDQVCDHRRGQ